MLKTTLTSIAAALLLALPGSALAAPAVTGEFPVSEMPKNLTQGPDGNIWATIGGKIARVTPAGVVTEFDPANVDSPFGITTGPDGNLWVTQSGGVAKFSTAAPNSAEKFAIGDITDPRAITTGPDGNLWTASGDDVVKIPPANPTAFTPYPVAGLSARDIASGGDGQLWVADLDGKRIISVTTAGTTKFYPVGGGVQGVVAGPGTQIAYASPSAPQHVGRISPGGAPLKTNIGGDPFGMTLGPDGAYWFARFASTTVGRMTPDGKVTTVDGLSAGSGPRYVTSGPGNTIWVSLEQGKKIARISGVVAPPKPVKPGAASDTVAPSIKKLHFSRKKVRFTLSEAARVNLVVTPRGRKARTLHRKGTRGRNVIRLRRLKRGRYLLTISARDNAGNKSLPKVARLRIVRKTRTR